MDDTTPVRREQRRPPEMISVKYPPDRVQLLKAVRERRCDTFMSDTIRHALDQLIEEHFPGSLEPVA